MKNPKRDDMVIMATCQQTKKTFGITVERKGKDFECVWAFKINAGSAQHEGFDKNKVHGNVSIAASYPGCPHCGASVWYQCGKCKRIVCMPPDQKIVQCPECGNKGEIQYANDFDLQGGAF